METAHWSHPTGLSAAPPCDDCETVKVSNKAPVGRITLSPSKLASMDYEALLSSVMLFASESKRSEWQNDPVIERLVTLCWEVLSGSVAQAQFIQQAMQDVSLRMDKEQAQDLYALVCLRSNALNVLASNGEPMALGHLFIERLTYHCELVLRGLLPMSSFEKQMKSFKLPQDQVISLLELVTAHRKAPAFSDDNYNHIASSNGIEPSAGAIGGNIYQEYRPVHFWSNNDRDQRAGDIGGNVGHEDPALRVVDVVLIPVRLDWQRPVRRRLHWQNCSSEAIPLNRDQEVTANARTALYTKQIHGRLVMTRSIIPSRMIHLTALEMAMFLLVLPAPMLASCTIPSSDF